MRLGIGPGTREFLPVPEERDRVAASHTFAEPYTLVSRANVYRVLGPVAYAAWGEMVADPQRDGWGDLRISTSTLLARLRERGIYIVLPGAREGRRTHDLTLRSLQRALKRLRDLGFVRERQRFDMTEDGASCLRTVRGIVHVISATATEERNVMLPITLARDLPALPSWCGHGGNRKIRVERGAHKGAVRAPFLACKPCDQVARGGYMGGGGGSADRGVSVQVSRPISIEGEEYPSKEGLRPPAAARDPIFFVANPANEEIDLFATLRQITTQPIKRPKITLEDVDKEARDLLPKAAARDSSLPRIRVPMPPRLTPEMEIDSAVRLLAVAYRAACTREFGKKSFAFVRGEIRDSKHYALLCAFAEKAKGLKLQPHKWVQFQIGLYRHNRKDAKGVPISYVFSTRALDNKRTIGWYRGVADTGDAVDVIRFVPGIHDLDKIKDRTERALVACRRVGGSAAAQRSIAREGAAAWVTRRSELWIETRSTQADLIAAMRGGVWIW